MLDHYPGLNTWVEQNIELRAECAEKDGWFEPKLWEHIKNCLTYVLNQMVNIVAQEDLDHPEKVKSGKSYPPAIIDRLNALLTTVPDTKLIPKRRVPHQPKLKKRYRQDYLKPGQIPNSKKSKTTNANEPGEAGESGEAAPVVKPTTSTSVPVHDSPAQDLPVAKKQKKNKSTYEYVEADDSEFDSDEEESEEEEEAEDSTGTSTSTGTSIDNKFGSTSKNQSQDI